MHPHQLGVDARRRAAGRQAQHAVAAFGAATANHGGDFGCHRTTRLAGMAKYSTRDSFERLFARVQRRQRNTPSKIRVRSSRWGSRSTTRLTSGCWANADVGLIQRWPRAVVKACRLHFAEFYRVAGQGAAQDVAWLALAHAVQRFAQLRWRRRPSDRRRPGPTLSTFPSAVSRVGGQS